MIFGQAQFSLGGKSHPAGLRSRRIHFSAGPAEGAARDKRLAEAKERQ
jgi:hypothetical protein